MKSYIVLSILIFSQSGFGQPSDPYYEMEDKFSADGKCGNGRTSDIVPDSPFGYNFGPSCAFHDQCYDTCGQPKKICDEHFRGDMNGSCRNRFGRFDARRYTCLGVAQTYWEAVNTLGGDSYKAAQDEACK